MLAQTGKSGARWLGLPGPAVAMFLAVSPLYAEGASVTSATDVQKEEAGNSFKRGAEAFNAGQLDVALAAFQRSLDVVSSPNSRLMLARTLTKLGRPVEAYVQFERTLTDAEQAAQGDKKYASTADAARAELAELRQQVGLLSVQLSGVSENDSLNVGGREIARADWTRPVAVAPGKARVVLRTASGEVVREVDIAAGGAATVTVSPPPPDSRNFQPESDVRVSGESSSVRTIGFVAGGIGIAGFISFVVFGQLNNAKFDRLRGECPNNRCQRYLEGERDAGKTYQAIANVSLGVGVVGLATGAVLLLMNGGESERPAEARRGESRGLRFGAGPGHVDVSGSF
jgi:tetratricopeptide (TPR) repeat protein